MTARLVFDVTPDRWRNASGEQVSATILAMLENASVARVEATRSALVVEVAAPAEEMGPTFYQDHWEKLKRLAMRAMSEYDPTRQP